MDTSETNPAPASGKVRSGKARMEKLTPAQRSDLARAGAAERWRKARATRMQVANADDPDEVVPAGPMPGAKYKGVLNLVGMEIPCYVLDNGQRVIGRTSAT